VGTTGHDSPPGVFRYTIGMDLTFAQGSDKGPLRPKNEDLVAFWEPPTPDERRIRGAVAIIADGVGGQGQGEVAARLAVETALEIFVRSKPGVSLNSLLWQMFNHANLTVFQAAQENAATLGRMATTMTITVFRNDQIGIGHIGDCRTYLVHNGQIRCLTTDHTHIAADQNLGMFTAQEALQSPLGSVLTRYIGKDPLVVTDFYYATVAAGDFVVQCTDGLYVYVTPEEILALLQQLPPAEAVQNIIGLCLARGAEDNASVQVARIDRVEKVTYYRGNPIYTQPPVTTGQEITIGQVLDDRFEITDVLSRSGMASILKALDRQLGQYVALKVPFLQYESDPAFYSRFEREEAIGRVLDHPSILRIIPLEKEKKSRPYIAMELLKGKTLDQVIQQRRPMPTEEALGIAIRLCAALDYMHKKNVVHRDLKPQNIMICDDGSLRIMDFGIAKAGSMRRITFTGFSPAMGTPDYMAPEQVKGRRGDERTDIYSLGAILYEMLTGTTPFEGPNPFAIMQARVTGDPLAPRSINGHISPQIEEIILHAMARPPGDRYDSVAALEAELRNPEAVTVTGRAARLQTPQLWKAQWRRIRNILLVAAIPLIAFGIILFAHMHRH